MLELEIFAKLHFFSPLNMCLGKHSEGFDSIYRKQEERGLFAFFCSSNKILIQRVIQDEYDRQKAQGEGKDPTGAFKLF